LKRQTAEVSSKAAPVPKNCFFIEEATRKDSAVRVSLSSYSLFKQPGDHGDPQLSSSPESRRSPYIRELSDTVSLFQ
jgi:hypothetical protein